MNDLFDMDEIFMHLVQQGTTTVRREIVTSDSRHSFLTQLGFPTSTLLK